MDADRGGLETALIAQGLALLNYWHLSQKFLGLSNLYPPSTFLIAEKDVATLQALPHDDCPPWCSNSFFNFWWDVLRSSPRPWEYFQCHRGVSLVYKRSLIQWWFLLEPKAKIAAIPHICRTVWAYRRPETDTLYAKSRNEGMHTTWLIIVLYARTASQVWVYAILIVRLRSSPLFEWRPCIPATSIFLAGGLEAMYLMYRKHSSPSKCLMSQKFCNEVD